MDSRFSRLLKSFARVFVALLFLMVPVTNSAQAQIYYPYYNHVVTGGYNYSYGWWPSYYWPGYWNVGDLNNFGVAYIPPYRYVPTMAVISYSASTGRFGSSWSYHKFSSAKGAAQRFCGASDCHPVVWVQGGCATVVISSKVHADVELPSAQKQVYWGVDTTRDAADKTAMHACQTHQGTFGAAAARCDQLAWACGL